MENDISLEEVKRDTSLREEKLQKMKNNIEALQLNMAKKKITTKSPQIKQVPIEPATFEERSSFEDKTKSPTNQHRETEFGYNSTLFRNINNDSQPIMNNGSAVSNFSSVSNINHLLNNHLQSIEEQLQRSKDPLLEDIDKILQKVQRTHKIPSKTFEKIMEKSNSKESGSIPEEALQNSKLNTNRGDISARTKLEEYKLLINNLNPSRTDLEQKMKPKEREKKEEKGMIQTDNYYDFGQEFKSYRSHKKQPSGVTVKSEDQYFEFRSKPPTPPSRQFPKNAVERQKMLIKQSVQQYKKLETESSHEMWDHSEIDFELSDDEDHKKGKQSKHDKASEAKISSLKKEKQDLQAELERIQQELEALEAQI